MDFGVRLPRSRGDGPVRPLRRGHGRSAAPLTRGWTLAMESPMAVSHGCPAHAGMDPSGWAGAGWWCRLPRSRGDGPYDDDFSGITLRAAPLTRGWTHRHTTRRLGRAGCPAHAGMDPGLPPARRPAAGLPRSRGDGPCRRHCRQAGGGAAPLTRGWTRAAGLHRLRHLGCPAHAGMDPAEDPAHEPAPRLPRSRGDGPEIEARYARLTEAAPLTRGWTPGAAL